MDEEVPKVSSDYRPIARVGYMIVALTFGLLGGWAAMANIDSAVVATGVVSVESKRKAVQHLEGGIVREINVRNGDRVEQGQILFRMDSTNSYANYVAVRRQLDAALGLEARLVAERDPNQQIAFPIELTMRSSDPEVARIIEDEQVQFRERRASLMGHINVLKKRITQYGNEIEGLDRERQSAEQQLYFIQDELVGVSDLAKRGLVAKTRESSLEREKARLSGVIGRNQADSAKAQNAINEMEIQIQQIQQQFQEQVSQNLADIRLKIGDLRERMRVAQDVLKRVEIVAPRAGIVHNLKIFTLGGVIRPGETLLEIVPEDDDLVVEVHVEVNDIDRIHTGLEAEVRFPAFHSRSTPLIIGTLQDISRDRLIDENTRMPYYLAQVAVRDTDVPTNLKERLRPGMPAEVVFPTGERTVLDYLTRPLTEAVTTSFRER